jgi:uncharacterized damage-inducible protein DinB
MSGAKLLRLMANYHVTVNEALLKSIPSAEIAQRKVPIGFGSILATVNHIAAVDDLWLRRIKEDPAARQYDYIYQNVPEKSGKSDDELWFELTKGNWAMSQRLLRERGHAVRTYVETLALNWEDETSLRKADATVSSLCNYHTTDGQPRQVQRGAALMHLFNHATDHRGQIHSALSTFGLSGATVDMPAVMGMDKFRF